MSQLPWSHLLDYSHQNWNEYSARGASKMVFLIFRKTHFFRKYFEKINKNSTFFGCDLAWAHHLAYPASPRSLGVGGFASQTVLYTTHPTTVAALWFNHRSHCTMLRIYFQKYAIRIARTHIQTHEERRITHFCGWLGCWVWVVIQQDFGFSGGYSFQLF